MLLRTKAMLLGCTLMLGACEPKPAEPATPLATTSFSFNIVDTAGVPISGVQVTEVVDSNEQLLGQTAEGGQLSVADHVTGNLTVTFAKSGYAPQVWTGDLQSPQSEGIVMIQREVAMVFDATVEADVDGKDGASVEVSAGAFIGVDGLPYTGLISVNITPVDVASDATEAGAFPGSFNAVLESGAEQPLITYGTVEYYFTDENGNELQLAEGQTATIEIPIYTPTHPDGSIVEIGDVIPFWYLDETTGIWHEDGSGTVVASESSPTGLAQRGEVTHFTWWNCDISPNPGTVTIETTLPDYDERTYRLEYKVTPLSSPYSARKDTQTYLGGGLATFEGYIPADTRVNIEVVLYRYLDDAQATYAVVARDGGTYFFAEGDELVLEYDFSDQDSPADVFEPNITINVFDPVGAEVAAGGSVFLIPNDHVNFAFAQVEGIVFSQYANLYELEIADGPQWLSGLLSMDFSGQIRMFGVVPEFDDVDVVFDLVDSNGVVAHTFTVQFVSGDELSISLVSDDIVLQTNTSVQFALPEIVGGYPEYTVSFLPNSNYLPPLVTTSGSMTEGFQITGVAEGRTSVQFRVYDKAMNSVASDAVNVLVLASAPQLADIADLQYLLGRNLNVQSVIENGIVTEWSYRGELPSGITFDSVNGSFTGTLNTVGTFNLSVVAANMLGESVSDFVVRVNPEPVLPLTVTDLDLQTLTGVQASAWSLITGSLPQGMELNAATGVIAGAAQEAGVFLLEFDADGQVITFTLTISEILNNAPDIAIEASDIARFGSVAYADILLSDVDGDDVTFEAQLLSAEGVAEISRIKNNEVKIEISLDAVIAESFVLKILATDSFGMTSEAEHTFTIERQDYAQGQLLNKIPTVNEPRLVDTGDSCVLYSEFDSELEGSSSNVFHIYDKTTQTWQAQVAVGFFDHYILDVEHADDVTVWGGYIKELNGYESPTSSIRAGFIENGKLINFPTLPALSDWNSNGTVQEVLPFYTDSGDLRVLISIRDEGVFLTDDRGESWQVVFMDEYMGFTADRIIGRNGLILMHGKALNQYGYFSDYQLISNDSGSTWSELSIYASYSTPYLVDAAFDSTLGLYVAVGKPYRYETSETSPGLLFSSDGINWELGNRLPVLDDAFDANEVTFSSISFSNGLWTAVGNDGSQSVIVQSTDGITWQILNISNELDANIASVSDCTGRSNIFLSDGRTLLFDDESGEYLLADEEVTVTAWMSPADGTLGLTAYVQEYSIDNGDYVMEGALVYQSNDASNWAKSQLLIDGNAAASFVDEILQESSDKWLMFGGQAVWSSEDGFDFNTFNFTIEPPESYPEFYEGNFENMSYRFAEGVISEILIGVNNEVWRRELSKDGFYNQSLGNINDLITEATVEDIRFISLAINNRFYIVVDQVQGENVVSRLIQYSLETGLTLEEGCWFNDMCMYKANEFNPYEQLILPVSNDHFVLFNYPESIEDFITAVKHKKMAGGSWSTENITFMRPDNEMVRSNNMPFVVEKTSVSPYLVSSFATGVMAYDEEAGTMTGPLNLGGRLIDSVSRTGDQFFVKTGSYNDPAAYILPLNKFSDVELSEMWIPEMINVPRPIVNVPR